MNCLRHASQLSLVNGHKCIQKLKNYAPFQKDFPFLSLLTHNTPIFPSPYLCYFYSFLYLSNMVNKGCCSKFEEEHIYWLIVACE